MESQRFETVDCSIASWSAESELKDKIITTFRTADKRLRDVINRFIHGGCHPNTELAALEVGHSIRCVFCCGTPDALQSLYISINNGSLITTMQWIFQQLLGCEESVFVVNINGQLKLDEQTRRIEEFCKDIGSNASDQLSEDLSVAAMSGFQKLFWLPYDVLEPLLLQVALTVFKRNQVRLLLPRPDVTAIVTISSVCKDWFDVINGRRILRRKLKTTFRKSTVIPAELLKAAVLLRRSLIDQPMTSHDADVTVLKRMALVCDRWKVAIGGSGDLKRVKRPFHFHPQLLITLNGPPANSEGEPIHVVVGVVLLENFVYVVYDEYNKVEVFSCDECYKKVKDIEVEEMKQPWDMVGSSVTSQLLIYDQYHLRRVDLKTGVSDVFVKLPDVRSRLSLAENRLLVPSRHSLLMYDIHSGERINKIPYTVLKKYVVWYAIESNRDSFFVSHGPSDNNKVSEIKTDGRVIREISHDKQLNSFYLATDSVGRLLVTDNTRGHVVLLDEYLKFKRILIDNKRLDAHPLRLTYSKNNNRLAVGLDNGKVKIFECKDS